jgi:AcrR family transcriptional regulator
MPNVDNVNMVWYCERMRHSATHPTRDAPPATPGRKRRNTYHHGHLRRALLDQALETIRDEGIEALTLRAVGQKLRVSRTALYRHFADKRSLLAAVAAEGFRRLREALVTAWEGAGRGRPGFEAMGLAYVRFAVANPSYYRVMFGGFVDASACDATLLEEASGAFQALVDALVEQQHHGLVRADDPQQLARFIWAAVHGVAMLAIDGQLQQQHATAADLSDYAIERLRAAIAPDDESLNHKGHKKRKKGKGRKRHIGI